MVHIIAATTPRRVEGNHTNDWWYKGIQVRVLGICHDPRVEAADVFRRWLDPVDVSKLWRGFESMWKPFRRPFVAGTQFSSFTTLEGAGAGNWAYWFEMPAYSSASSKDNRSTLAIDRRDFDIEDDLVSNGIGETPLRGALVVGLVLDPVRVSVGDIPFPEPDVFEGCVVRSCAADTEGRSLRGVTDPLTNAVMSSPLADGPADANVEPFWDLVSVDEVPWLPLRLRNKYFSIASASRSLMRFAIGDKAEAGLGGGLSRDPFGGAWNVVPFEGTPCGGWWLAREWLRKTELDPVDGWEGDDDNWPAAKLSGSPLSEVAVVRLVPDPLLILGAMRSFAGTGGGAGRLPPHSFPLAAAWANIFRRCFLLFSNCIRAVSWRVSLVLNLRQNDFLKRVETIRKYERVGVIRGSETLVISSSILTTPFYKKLNCLCNFRHVKEGKILNGLLTVIWPHELALFVHKHKQSANDVNRLTNEVVYSPYCPINQNLLRGRTASDVKMKKLMSVGSMKQQTNIPARVPHFLWVQQYAGQFSLVYLTNPRPMNNDHNRVVPFVKKHRWNPASLLRTHMPLVVGLLESLELCCFRNPAR